MHISDIDQGGVTLNTHCYPAEVTVSGITTNNFQEYYEFRQLINLEHIETAYFVVIFFLSLH